LFFKGELMNSNSKNVPIYGVILSGGSGTRFWPLSRSQCPKQVLHILGSDSLFQATIDRLQPRIPLENLFVITNASQEDVIRLELYRKGWEKINVWLEPHGKNTAAAVALAAIRLAGGLNNAILAVFPADHSIQDKAAFLEALDTGARWAAAGYLVTFGIHPNCPATSYGYIKAARPLDAAKTVFECEKFTEKPELSLARKLLAAGDYYWNSGMFMFRLDAINQALSRYLPQLFQAFQALREHDTPETVGEVYNTIQDISLDHGIMEHATNVAVIPIDIGWNDVGSWDAMHELYPRDERGNVILGHVFDRDSQDSLIYSQDRLVATLGLDKVIVVDTPDATLVCHRDRTQEVKDLVKDLDRKRYRQVHQHLTVDRPWGSYTVMAEAPGYKVKKIIVAPGKRLSLQMHNFRAEHWVVVQGLAQATVGNEILTVPANESVFIPLKTAHRLANQTERPLKIIEVQTGSYLEEDDIIRLEDDFGRYHQDVPDAEVPTVAL
jgi:mannose-1-phosphate guanylyltransferase / mannose-6-phosphate isomerase